MDMELTLSLEQAALLAVSAVTTALVFVSKMLIDRSNACESHRLLLQDKVNSLLEDKGRLDLMKTCPREACPYRVPRAVITLACALMFAPLAGCAGYSVRAGLTYSDGPAKATISFGR